VNVHFKFEANRASQSQDTSEQSFEIIFRFFLILFAHFAFSAITCYHILLSNWNLVHVKGWLKHISSPYLVGIRLRSTELGSIFRIKKVDGLSRLLGKPLEGIGWNLACRWSNHRRSAFLWFERNAVKDYGDMTQNSTGVKIMQSNLWIKSPSSYTPTVHRSELKIGV